MRRLIVVVLGLGLLLATPVAAQTPELLGTWVGMTQTSDGMVFHSDITFRPDGHFTSRSSNPLRGIVTIQGDYTASAGIVQFSNDYHQPASAAVPPSERDRYIANGASLRLLGPSGDSTYHRIAVGPWLPWPH